MTTQQPTNSTEAVMTTAGITNTINAYHVTRVTDSDVYGHNVNHCDECGCNGDEQRLGLDPDAVECGRVYEVSDAGIWDVTDEIYAANNGLRRR